MIKQLIPLVLLIIALGACTDDQSFTVGEDLVNVNSSVAVIDTITIDTYTIKADSIITSGFFKALTGRYSDGAFGSINASAFFQIAVPTATALEDNSRFDSICVILKPNGYCYGDSTKPYSINIHKLTEDLSNTEISDRYNVSKVLYSSEILGSRSEVIKPHSGKNISIRLNDNFGQELFTMMQNDAEEFESQSNFSEYLKGFALTSNELHESPVFQFDLADSLVVMQLYYHTGWEEKTINFNFINTESLQYNQIESDYQNSPLFALKTKEDVLPSTLTNNESYCQAGTGVMTRIEFPYLKNLFATNPTYKILKAELIIRPVKKTFHLIPLPDEIYLYQTNTLNDIGSLLTNSQNETVSPTIYIDNMYNETRYEFDITAYISYMVSHLKDDPPSLILSSAVNNNGYSLDRLIIGNYYHPTNAMRLKITYWKY